MKKRILILEQQSWFGGAQRVLDVTMDSLTADFDATVAFPDVGAFAAALDSFGLGEVFAFPNPARGGAAPFVAFSELNRPLPRGTLPNIRSSLASARGQKLKIMPQRARQSPKATE